MFLLQTLCQYPKNLSNIKQKSVQQSLQKNETYKKNDSVKLSDE